MEAQRLESISGMGDLEYSYDGAGHRTSATGSFARTALPQPVSGNIYNTDNQLTQSNGLPLTYDCAA